VKAKARNKEAVEKLCQMYLPKDDHAVRVLAEATQAHDHERIQQSVRLAKVRASGVMRLEICIIIIIIALTV
jgi:hypothetical protein